MIGLGYVGLPVAVAFARSGVPVVGFDISQIRIKELRAEKELSLISPRGETFAAPPAQETVEATKARFNSFFDYHFLIYFYRSHCHLILEDYHYS